MPRVVLGWQGRMGWEASLSNREEGEQTLPSFFVILLLSAYSDALMQVERKKELYERSRTLRK